MTEYKRSKPHLYNKNIQHTCYEGHDCQESWTVGHHLAQALEILSFRGVEGKTWSPDKLFDLMEEASHHIRKAWDKIK